MKKVLLGISMAAVLGLVTAQAAMLNITRNDGYYTGSGGEFTIKITDAGSTGVSGTFQSFCLEVGTTVNIPSNNPFTVGPNAELGGSGGPHPDPISIGTAYLYSQFRSGALAGYNYTPGTDREASAGALQDAIWYLEGETGGVDNSFVTAAKSALGNLTDAQIKDNANGAYGVVALNLWSANGTDVQSQLGLVPEPTTVLAGLMLLLPFGVSALRIIRRNKA